MEFFEFDNSFIGGYGEKTTSLKSGDEGVSFLDAKGYNIGSTCNKVQSFKDKGYDMCINDFPYAAKNNGIIKKGDVNSALKPGGSAKFVNPSRKGMIK